MDLNIVIILQIEALQEVIEKLKNKQLPQTGEKFSLLPSVM